VSPHRQAQRDLGISLPAIMALGVIEGRRARAMGSVMGLLTLGHSLGMLVGPLIEGIIIGLFPIGTVFIFGAVILGSGTLVFARNHWKLKGHPG
jgi:DHA1 family multidrug resistance protein-like MFS transporter